MKKQQPFLPFFIGDFMASTVEWEGEEASLYLTLLCYQWSLESLPTDAGKLCKIIRWDRDLFDRMWPTVAIKFIERNGRLINERLEQHRAKSRELSKKNKLSGQKGGETKQRNRSERYKSAISETVANANRDAIANATKALSELGGADVANATFSVEKRSSENVAIHPIPSHPNLRVLARGENLG